MKKILSLVLVLSLVLGTFSFAFAATPEDVVGEDSQEAVETLMALGVVNGYPDGTYKPEKTVTRAEMTKLLVEALGYGELAEGATSTFADVQGTWAESYVGFAASMDIVNGYPDGTFKPSQEMTVNEAMTMVIRALGYTDEVLKGTWPTNYKVKALDLGLTDDLSSLSGNAKRGDVAILLFNALDANLVEVIKDSNGLFTYEYVKASDWTSADPVYKILLDKMGTKVTEKIDVDDVFGDDALDTLVDLEQYLFHTITYYENSDGDIAYVSDIDTEEFVGTLTDYDSNDDGTIDVENDDLDEEETFKDVDDAELFYNGDEADGTTVGALSIDGETEIKVVYDEDDVIQGIVAWEFEVDQMNSEYSVRRPLKLNGVSGWDLPEDSDDDGELDEDAVMVEGDADSLEAIEEDDVVYYYASDDLTKVKLLVVRDTFTGEMTQRDTDGKAGTFDGEEFDVSDFSDVNLKTDADFGDEYLLYLDKEGDIFAIELEDEDTTESYAVFIDVADGTIDEDDFSGENDVDKTPRVKLFTEGGDVVIYDLDTSDLDFDAASSDDLGDIEVEVNVTDMAIYVNTSLMSGDLLEVEMNDDGEITNVVSIGMAYDDNDYDEDEMLLDDMDVTEDTVIFDITESDEDDWTISDAADLNDGIIGLYEYSSSSFEVLAMTVTDGAVESDVDYAIIIDVVEYYDGDDTVEKLTVYHNGEEKVLYTDDDYDTEDYIDDVVELTLDGGDVVDYDTTPTYTSITVEDLDSKRISDDSDVWTFADNLAVYVYTDGDWEIGELSDILEGDDVNLYLDEDGEDVVVITLDLDAAAE